MKVNGLLGVLLAPLDLNCRSDKDETRMVGRHLVMKTFARNIDDVISQRKNVKVVRVIYICIAVCWRSFNRMVRKKDQKHVK